MWDAATGQIQNILTDHRDNVNRVVFTPDSSTLMSGSRDKTIRVWDVATGLQKEVITGHEASIYSIALSPDGSTLMSGSDDNEIYFWMFPQENGWKYSESLWQVLMISRSVQIIR